MRLWPVAYESVDLASRFGRTHVVACGPQGAPPLMLLHCFAMSLTSWAHNVADLSRDYRVYAPDMMGQPGRSIPDQPIRTRAEMTEWLSGVLNALGVGQTDLVGYSYGGFAALNYAIQAPDRVKRLVVLAPAGGLVPLRKQFYLRGMLNGLIPALIPGLGHVASRSLMRWMFYQPNLRIDQTRELYDRIVEQFALGTKHFRFPKDAVMPAVYSDAELQGIVSPTLLLVGRHEALCNPEAAVERARRLIPDIDAELFPEAGHDLPVSQPVAVDRRILTFLQRPVDEREATVDRRGGAFKPAIAHARSA
jgi:pimeloyl-ACP methyl ester carboxylesterase